MSESINQDDIALELKIDASEKNLTTQEDNLSAKQNLVEDNLDSKENIKRSGSHKQEKKPKIVTGGNADIKYAHDLKYFGKRFVTGSKGTKASYFIMGFNNFLKGQYIKGSLFLLIEIAFFVFMALVGVPQLIDFVTLGTSVGYQIEGSLISVAGDNSMLMLLFGTVTFMVIACFAVIYIASTKSSYLSDVRAESGKKQSTFREDLRTLLTTRFHIALLTPAMAGVLAFTVLPIIFMILIAFTNYDQDHLPPGKLFDWVGFDNFAGIFNGSNEIGKRFFPVLAWTLCWAFFATFSNYIFGIIIALLINKKSIKAKALWRTCFVLTIAVPQFITLFTMRSMLSINGPINGMLMNFGWVTSPIDFLGNNPWLARVVIILVNMWIGIPFTILITTGILLNIPADLYEAARIDGASPVKMFLRITMPYIIFVTTPYLITQFIGNINNFNVIYLLSGGGPSTPSGDLAGETDLLITWLYKLTVDKKQYSLGSVIGIMTFIISAVLSLLTYRHTASYKKEDNFQ